MMEKLSALKKEHPVMFWGGIAISVIIFVVIVRGSSSSGSTTTASSDDTAASTQLAMAQLAEQEDATDSAAQTQQLSSTNQLAAVKDEDNTQVLVNGQNTSSANHISDNNTSVSLNSDNNITSLYRQKESDDQFYRLGTLQQQADLGNSAINAAYAASKSNGGIIDSNDTSIITDALKGMGSLGNVNTQSGGMS